MIITDVLILHFLHRDVDLSHLYIENESDLD